MRIQNNITAMNAQRNLSNNNNQLSSNLEKLSSGYRINRAADDAAGLAISEKMRAQITGLETGETNANDGIALVQTAEGALTEVHSMLNRMVELSMKASNGTYSETEREKLQSEMDELIDEIDRIAESTTFNGIDLLKGGEIEGVTGGIYSSTFNTALLSGSGITGGTANATVKATGLNDGVELAFATKNGASYATGEGDITAVWDSAANTITFEIAGGDDYAITKEALNDALDALVSSGAYVPQINNGTTQTPRITTFDEIKVNVATTEYSQKVATQMDATSTTYKNTFSSANAGNTTGLTLLDSAGNALGDLTGGFTITGLPMATANTSINPSTDQFGITSIEFVAAEDGTVASTGNTTNAGGGTAEIDQDGKLTITLDAGQTYNDEDITELINYAIKNYYEAQNEMNAVPNSDPSSMNIPEVTFKFDDANVGGINLSTGSATIGTADLSNQKPITITGEVTIDGYDSIVNNTVDYSADAAGSVIATSGANSSNYTAATSGTELAKAPLGLTTIEFVKGNTSASTEGYSATFDGTKMTVTVNADYATGVTTMDMDKINDAMNDALAAYYLEQVNGDSTALDTSEISKIELNGTIALPDTSSDFALTLTVAVEDGVFSGDGAVIASAKAEKTDIHYGDASSDVPTLLDTDDQASTYVEYDPGEGPIIIQVGNTNDDYQKVEIDRVSMSSDDLGVLGLDITSSQEAAVAALDKINEAIDKVSDVRSTFGAKQNRLDHTINNLGVAVENMQAAESRVRDVDMAAEMMEYTKNNILVQSAQAMLAQANQVPQGVLQLLQ